MEKDMKMPGTCAAPYKEALDALDRSNNWSERVADHEQTIRTALNAQGWREKND